jgi:hypothetical protein
MPEAAVRKNDFPSAWKDYVGFTRHIFAVQAKSVSEPVD